MKAVWQGEVIAKAPKDQLIYIEGNWYFPPTSVNQQLLQKSTTPYHCPWKGDCQYFHVVVGQDKATDAAWSYPEPFATAIAIVKKDFSNYIAFWHEVQVTE